MAILLSIYSIHSVNAFGDFGGIRDGSGLGLGVGLAQAGFASFQTSNEQLTESLVASESIEAVEIQELQVKL